MVKSIALSNVQTPVMVDKKWSAKYLAYCDSQKHKKIYWYLLPLVTLSSVVMPISIFLMSYFSFYIPFIGLTILIFYGNIVVHIAEQPPRITITTYFATLFFHFMVPLICFLLSCF